MPEPLSAEDKHIIRDDIKDLELDRAELARKSAGPSPELGPIDTDIQTMLTSIIESLSSGLETGAEQVFEAAVRGLDHIGAKRFILENLLESLKQGAELQQTLQRYVDLGLLSNIPPPPPNVFAGTIALLGRQGFLKRVATSVAHAAGTASKHLGLEPEFTVFPVPSLSFKIKADVKSYEAFQMIRRAYPPLK